MKNLLLIIKVTCNVIFCKTLHFCLQRTWFKFVKIKLIWLTCGLLSKIRKIRTYFIIWIIILFIFSKIVSPDNLWCLKFNLFIFNWNIFFIWLLMYSFIRIHHTVCIFFQCNCFLFIFKKRPHIYLMFYFC